MQTTGINDIDRAIDKWIGELDQYNLNQLLAKPSATGWSMGQLYIHLIQSTQFFIRQMNDSASSNNNIDGEAYAAARTMFNDNDLPDTLLEGPPSNAMTPQPVSKEQLLSGLEQLKMELHRAIEAIRQSTFKGKTKHSGLGYFTAEEWLQFAEMHMRHHQRQKKRLDLFLTQNDIK